MAKKMPELPVRNTESALSNDRVFTLVRADEPVYT